MRLVYERADRVVIWLGNEREESAIAMDLMRRVADILDPMTMMLIGAASESMIYRCVKLIVANFGFVGCSATLITSTVVEEGMGTTRSSRVARKLWWCVETGCSRGIVSPSPFFYSCISLVCLGVGVSPYIKRA